LKEGTVEEISLQAFPKNDVMFCSRVFHRREAVTGKARFPMAERWVQ